ncbi:hypothetical protein [Sporolactobacillus laevolacticus]|uniref:hypothetical protein n=1 Tax=Sporolactobacillus laevolacticus TaxID=33018 RepID=UPI0025B4A8F5|nr:hypothetical protein [Sporolactobacillus laevolacticus]MDN3953563.1 hypothetical protein [Sporolactobacillus laevolacticus]
MTGSSEKIQYKGTNYVRCKQDIDIDLNKGLKKITKKIGEDNQGNNVYAVKGLSLKNFIYFEGNVSMGDGGPVGLYVSPKMKRIISLTKNPNSLRIYAIQKKSYDSSKSIKILETKNLILIKKVVSYFNKGKFIPSKKMNEIKIAKEYNIDFSSSKYPNLVETYDLVKSNQGKLYITSRKSFEVSKGISKLILIK